MNVLASPQPMAPDPSAMPVEPHSLGLRAFLKNAPRCWGERELFAITALRFPDATPGQIVREARYAGNNCSGRFVYAMVRETRAIVRALPLIVAIRPATGDAFVHSIRTAMQAGFDLDAAALHAALACDVPRARELMAAARREDFYSNYLSKRISCARALSRIVRKELVRQAGLRAGTSPRAIVVRAA